MVTHPDSQRLEVNAQSQVVRIMIPPHVTDIEQNHPSYQAHPIMDGNMMNNNHQGIMLSYETPNASQPRVHINMAPQNIEFAQVVPIHVNISNPNHSQAYVGTQNIGTTST